MSWGVSENPAAAAAAAGFSSIVVALDLGPAGDRALPVVRNLAANHDVAIELLTVSSPNVAEDVDAYELSRRARENGWPDATCTIVHDASPARGIVDHLATRDRALLVMAADKRPLRTRVLGSIGEEVLRTASSPIVLVGPSVAADPAATDRSVQHGRCVSRRRGRPSRRGAQPGRSRASRRRGVLAAVALDPCRPPRRVRRGRPLIFPVNYVVDGNSIVFRTADGTKLAAAGDKRGLRDRRL